MPIEPAPRQLAKKERSYGIQVPAPEGQMYGTETERILAERVNDLNKENAILRQELTVANRRKYAGRINARNERIAKLAVHLIAEITRDTELAHNGWSSG